ncbi:HAD-IIIA family hydrolase [Butyrivibrio fibrisolvens]|uniref:HAD-IIIA family hydrolase n=1 Tax=Butyrivibrio fibrisolvens TaxID=831 RepID=UPI0003B7A2BF|nr:HAD-IIIA family hydrolase [Butyrivibrio fibrisolvens]
MKCVLMAGGKGTRISSIASDIPKPMIKVCGKPVLEQEIECLKSQGITDIIITISHLGYVIQDYFGDGSKISPVTGKPFGVNIEYFDEKVPLGNAGALFELKDKLTEDFYLLNADSIFSLDLLRFAEFHREKGALATILTHPNSHPYDSGLVITDKNGRVEKWLSKEEERPEFYKNRVNAGVHILSPKLLENRPDAEKIDLDRMILKPLAGSGKLLAYDSPEYIHDMGTPERYEQVCNDWTKGLPEKRNLRNKQKAIFLDRDGTINKYIGFLRNKDDFELIDGASEAICKINESEYLAIVITNQPVIARGEVTVEELDEIHNKMETLLGEKGAYINDLFYCPHHPDKGFEGEVPELKIKCDCRKPAPGLIYKAAEKYNIDLSESWMVGDGERDVQAGKNAGCKTAFIGNGSYGQDLTGESLKELVERILD